MSLDKQGQNIWRIASSLQSYFDSYFIYLQGILKTYFWKNFILRKIQRKLQIKLSKLAYYKIMTETDSDRDLHFEKKYFFYSD